MSLLLHRICRLSKSALGFLKPRPSYIIFIFFFILSGIFWLLTTLNDYYDEEVVIPVHLIDLPKGMVITNDDYDSLHVVIHDRGYALAGYVYGRRDKNLALSFNYFTRQVDKATLTSTDLQKIVQAHFGSTTQVVSVKPERMELTFCIGKPRVVPVLLRGRFTPAESHYLADTIITPKTVTVYGVPSVLAQIKYVTTENINLKNFSDTIVKEIRLKKIPNTRIEPAKIKVKFCPDILMENEVEVTVTPINVPEGKSMKTFPSRVKVTFSTGASQYKRISPDNFVVTVDYNEIREESNKCPLHLRKVPRSVTKASTDISQIDFLIEE